MDTTTQWRGSLRDGGASGFTEPASWPPSLTRQWKAVVGEGYATPLVIGSTVYAFTRQNGREVVSALDARTGAEMWRTDYLVDFSPGHPAAAHGRGPKATPVFHDGRLFTLGVTGVLSAFDAAARKLLWQTSPPQEVPYFGAASSPLVERDLVIVHPGNYQPLTAFDMTTGVIRWTAGPDGFFASPVAATLDDVRQVVTATTDSVIGVSLDGEVLWRYAWNGGDGSTTPVVRNGTIIVSGLDKGVLALRPMRRGGGWEVQTVWQTRDVSMYLSNPVIVDTTLFGLSHRNHGQFFALDAASGDLLWLGQPRQTTNAALVKAGRLLFLLQDDGELIVAGANRTRFEAIAQYTVADSATWAQPEISGDRILVKDANSLSLWTIGSQ